MEQGLRSPIRRRATRLPPRKLRTPRARPRCAGEDSGSAWPRRRDLKGRRRVPNSRRHKVCWEATEVNILTHGALLQRNASAMLYFLTRPRLRLIRGPVFVHLGASSWSIRGKQVPIALEGDLSLNEISGRVTA